MDDVRCHLQSLIDKIDSRSMSQADFEMLSMTLLMTKYSKFMKSDYIEQEVALRYLAVGWFVSGLSQFGETEKN